MGAKRWTRARLSIGLLACLATCGCAAGLIGLVAIAVSGGGGGGGGTVPVDTTSITAIEPRQSAVVGGVTITITGQNFDDGAAVSVGGQPALNVQFVDEQTLRATIPFNDLGSPDVDSGTPDPGTFSVRYTETNPANSRVRVTTRDHGASDSPFWYIRPRLSEIEPTFGNLGKPRAAIVEGKFFGFSSPSSATRVWLEYQDGSTREIPAGSIAAIDPACLGGCPEDPNQGTSLSVFLPDRTGDFSDLTSGPDYLLRIVSENGVDEIEIGYAPPFPPESFVCTVIQNPSIGVRLSWEEDAFDDPIDGEDGNPNQPFDRVIIERDGVQLATVAGGVGQYVDTAVQNRIYKYRVYGEVDGAGGEAAASPAVRCTVAVAPPDVPLDLIWDVRPIRLPRAISKGTIEDEPLQESADLLYRAVQRHAVPFVFRGMSFSDPAGEFLRPLFDTDRIGITWITTSNQADFGALEDESFKTLRDYYGAGGPGGIYLEGQHVAAAIAASATLREIAAGGLGIDPLRDLRSVDRVRSVTAPGSSLRVVGFTGSAGAVVGLQQSALSTDGLEFPLRISGDVTNPNTGGTVVENFVSALASQGGQFVLSHLSLGGLSGADTQQDIADELVDIYHRYLSRSQASEGDVGVADSFSPSGGAVGGSTDVSFTGTNLDMVLDVLFGTTPGSIVGQTADSLTVRTPAVPIPGRVPIILVSDSNETRQVSSPGDFLFQAPVVALTDLSPRSGQLEGGDEVTITGQNFTPPPDLQVFFGGRTARIKAGSATSTSVVCFAPAATNAGQVTVIVQTSGGIASGAFTYGSGPLIDQLVPNCCTSPAEPTAIEIRGSGFTDAQRVEVCEEGILEDMVVVSDTLITGTVPAQGETSCELAVVGESGTRARTSFGCPCGPPPSIVNVTPSLGSTDGGTTIDIVGQNFTEDMTATLCGAPLPLTFFDAELVRATTPDNDPGPCALTLTNSNGQGELLEAFTYVLGPQIAAVNPPCCTVFDTVTPITITGSGFTASTTVTLCGEPLADMEIVSDTTIKGTAPPQDCDIQVSNEFGADLATFTCPCSLGPTITSIAPSSGSTDGGDTVVITGTGFTEDTTATICGIGVDISSFTSTELQGVTPAGSVGPCDVFVANANGTDTLAGGFVYDLPDPIIESIAPDFADTTGGEPFTIRGQNFTSGTEVFFNEDLVPNTVFVDATEITGTIPADLGVNCVCDVSVSNDGEPATPLPDPFRYGPYIAAISPDGPIDDNGGATLTISGNCFDANTIARLCGGGPSVGFVSPTVFSATTPAGCGNCDVQLQNPAGQHTLANAFSYVSPAIRTISPNVGPAEGGTTVTITGENFTAQTQVLVCGNPVKIGSLTPTQIVGTSPAGSGVCDVSVSNVGGGCAPDVLPSAWSYDRRFLNILSLGESEFDLDNDDPIMGGTELRDFITQTEGHTVEEMIAVTVTVDLLLQYDVVIFSEKKMTQSEADAFEEYIEGGGGVILAGQLGSFADSSGRNLISERYGIKFNDDVFADPIDFFSYPEPCLPCDDSENPWEYARLTNMANHPVTIGVSAILLNWGQTLTVNAPAQAVATGSFRSYGDVDAEFVNISACCASGYFINTEGEAPSGGIPGVAVVESGLGRLVALGDHDQFWNFWFDHPSFPGHRTLVRNMLDWVSQR